jgi:hypothetical protein
LRLPVAAGAGICLVILIWAYTQRRRLARLLEVEG